MLFRQLAEAVCFVMVEDGRDHRVGIVDHLDQVHVFGIDHVLRHQPRTEPVEQAGPELRADQDQRDAWSLAGLDQAEGFQQFVQRAEAAGHHHIRGGDLDEHVLAG